MAGARDWVEFTAIRSLKRSSGFLDILGHFGPSHFRSNPQQPVCGMDFVGYFFRSFEGSGLAASFCMRHGGAINIHHHKHS